MFSFEVEDAIGLDVLQERANEVRDVHALITHMKMDSNNVRVSCLRFMNGGEGAVGGGIAFGGYGKVVGRFC